METFTLNGQSSFVIPVPEDVLLDVLDVLDELLELELLELEELVRLFLNAVHLLSLPESAFHPTMPGQSFPFTS